MTGGFAVGWRQVGSCFLLLGAIAFIASGYSVIAIPLAAEFKTSRMVLMLAMTVLSGVSALLAPVLGTMMDRVSLRRLMMLGALLLAAGYGLLSFATAFVQVLVIFGLFIAPANVLLGPVSATVLLSRWFVKRRGTAVGVAIAGISMGAVLYPPLVQFLLDNFAWREALRLLALVLLLATFPAAALVIDRPADRGLYPDGAATAPDHRLARGAAGSVSARAILADPSFWIIALLVGTASAGMKGMITNLVPVALDEGISATDAALLISLYGASGLVSKLTFAALADRLSPRLLLFVAIGGFAAGMACISQIDVGYPMLVTGLVLVGLLGGFMVPLQSFLVPRIFGEQVVGRAMGLLSMILLVPMLLSPPLFGLGYDLAGSYAPVFLGFAAVAAAAILLVPYLRLHPRGMVDPRPSPSGKGPGVGLVR